ncbi:acyltransferase [Streptomyces sp. ODS28]|uniref:acyltransferase family protein n=1 Tax=Streptomyces sp. ODS28 TaxID=3136688 RepID=UPI0031E546AF
MSTTHVTAGPSSPVRPAPRELPGAGRLRALDGLRLVAALLVACYHYGGRNGEITEAWGSSPTHQFPYLSQVFAYGCLGVQFFFLISGFVICMSGWGRPLRHFAASRFARLMPAYWAAVVLVTLVFAVPGVVYEAVAPSDMLVNLTMLQEPLGVDRVLGVCWTLWAELRFYVLFALFVVVPGATRQRVVWLCAGWTLAAVLAEASGSELLEVLLMPQYAPFFIGGMGLYLLHRYGHEPTAWAIVGVSFLLGQHFAVVELWNDGGPGTFSYRPSAGIVAFVALGFAAVAAVALGGLRRVDWGWLTTAGALTYPFYLVHEHLGWVAIRGLHRWLGVPSWLTFLTTLTSMLLLAWALHRVVERRLGPALKRSLNSPLHHAG